MNSIVGDKEVFKINGVDLIDFPNTPLPNDLEKWFRIAMEVLSLNDIRCHYILNTASKKLAPNITFVGSIGKAYLNKGTFAFIESDFGRENDRDTIIHELLHFTGLTHDNIEYVDYEKHVKNIKVVVSKIIGGARNEQIKRLDQPDFALESKELKE